MIIRKNNIYIGDIYKLHQDEYGVPCKKLIKRNVQLYKVGNTYVEMSIMTDSRENFKYFESKIDKHGEVNQPNNNMFLSDKYPTHDGMILRDVQVDPHQDMELFRDIFKPKQIGALLYEGAETPIEYLEQLQENKENLAR